MIGPRIYNLFPLLAGKIERWTSDLDRIAAMGFDWVYVNPFHLTGGSRSLYAVADPRLESSPRGGIASPSAIDPADAGEVSVRGDLAARALHPHALRLRRKRSACS